MTADLHNHPHSRPLSHIIESPPTTPQKPILTTHTINTSPNTNAAPFGDQLRDQAVRKSVTWGDLISYRTIDLGVPDAVAEGGSGSDREEEMESIRLDRVSEDDHDLRPDPSLSYTTPLQGLSTTDEGVDLPPLIPNIASSGSYPSHQPGPRRLDRPRSLILGPKGLFLRALTGLHIGSGRSTVLSHDARDATSQPMDGDTKSLNLTYDRKTEVEVSHHPHPDYTANRPGRAEVKGILNRRPDDQVDRTAIEGLPLRSTKSFPASSPNTNIPGQGLDPKMLGGTGKRHRRPTSISCFPSGLMNPLEPNSRRRSSWGRRGRKDQDKEREQTKTIRTSEDGDLDILRQRTPRVFSPYPDEPPIASAQIKTTGSEYLSDNRDSKWTNLPPSDIAIDVRVRPPLRVQGAPRTGSRRTVSDPTLPSTARLLTDGDGPGDKAAGCRKLSELEGKDRHTIVRILKDELTLEEDGRHVLKDVTAKVAKTAPDSNDSLGCNGNRFDSIGRLQTAWDVWSRPDDAQRNAQREQRRRATSLNKALPRLPTLTDGSDSSGRGDQPSPCRPRQTTSGTPAVTQPENRGSFQAKHRMRSFERNDSADFERTRGELFDEPSYSVTTRAATPMICPSSSISLLFASALLSQQASRVLLELSSLAQASGKSDSAQATGGNRGADDMSEFKRRMEELARDGSEAGRGLMDCLMSGQAVGSPVVRDQVTQLERNDLARQQSSVRWSADRLSSVIFPSHSPEVLSPASDSPYRDHEHVRSILESAESTIQELRGHLEQLRPQT